MNVSPLEEAISNCEQVSKEIIALLRAAEASKLPLNQNEYRGLTEKCQDLLSRLPEKLSGATVARSRGRGLRIPTSVGAGMPGKTTPVHDVKPQLTLLRGSTEDLGLSTSLDDEQTPTEEVRMQTPPLATPPSTLSAVNDASRIGLVSIVDTSKPPPGFVVPKHQQRSAANYKPWQMAAPKSSMMTAPKSPMMTAPKPRVKVNPFERMDMDFSLRGHELPAVRAPGPEEEAPPPTDASGVGRGLNPNACFTKRFGQDTQGGRITQRDWDLVRHKPDKAQFAEVKKTVELPKFDINIKPNPVLSPSKPFAGHVARPFGEGKTWGYRTQPCGVDAPPTQRTSQPAFSFRKHQNPQLPSQLHSLRSKDSYLPVETYAPQPLRQTTHPNAFVENWQAPVAVKMPMRPSGHSNFRVRRAASREDSWDTIQESTSQFVNPSSRPGHESHPKTPQSQLELPAPQPEAPKPLPEHAHIEPLKIMRAPDDDASLLDALEDDRSWSARSSEDAEDAEEDSDSAISRDRGPPTVKKPKFSVIQKIASWLEMVSCSSFANFLAPGESVEVFLQSVPNPLEMDAVTVERAEEAAALKQRLSQLQPTTDGLPMPCDDEPSELRRYPLLVYHRLPKENQASWKRAEILQKLTSTDFVSVRLVDHAAVVVADCRTELAALPADLADVAPLTSHFCLAGIDGFKLRQNEVRGFLSHLGGSDGKRMIVEAANCLGLQGRQAVILRDPTTRAALGRPWQTHRRHEKRRATKPIHLVPAGMPGWLLAEKRAEEVATLNRLRDVFSGQPPSPRPSSRPLAPPQPRSHSSAWTTANADQCLSDTDDPDDPTQSETHSDETAW